MGCNQSLKGTIRNVCFDVLDLLECAGIVRPDPQMYPTLRVCVPTEKGEERLRRALALLQDEEHGD